jgi:hypothetical protein
VTRRPDALGEALDELYAADLEEFVSTRTRLAKQLREAGRREEADALAKLRKPPVAAWVLNQLARRNRREVDLLLDAGHRLREAQAGVLSGGEKDAFEQARNTATESIREPTREAEKLLLERGSPSGSVLGQVSESLRSAAISGTGRELLARGQFSEPLRAEGFDVVSEIAGTTTSPRAKRASAVEQAALRAAQAEVERAQRAEQEARRVADELEERARAARADADSAASRVRQAAHELEEAERKLRDATRSARRRRG